MGVQETKVQVLDTLTKDEQTAINKRKEMVKNSLAKLGIQCRLDQIPNIAVLGSGGGLRAMIALYGTLTELKKCNLLDCAMYLSGVSGSTWCMSSLYKNEKWSEEIETLEKHECNKLVTGKWDYYRAKDTLLEASKDKNYSLTDFWAYFIVDKMLKELDDSKLSEQRKSCENAKNPYPIYAAVDKDTYNRCETDSWFEFTPHDAGVVGIKRDLCTGAYVDIQDFGSLFREGQLSEKKKEKTISYLRGLWGSALGSMEEIKKAIIDALLGFLRQERLAYFPAHSKDPRYHTLNILSQAYEYVLELQLCVSDDSASKAEGFFDILEDLLQYNKTSKSYQLLCRMRKNWLTLNADEREKACLNLWEALNKDFGGELVTSGHLQGIIDWIRCIYKTNVCILTWTWGTNCNFLYNMPDVQVPDLKKKEVISLIDAGLTINSAYPLVLHPERKVKLLLSFDYSAGDIFETIKKAAEYCRDCGIKFPRIDDIDSRDQDNPSNCYIFRGDNLTVMHFPLFNIVNCKDKIAEYRKTFSTFKWSYTDEEIGKLLIAAKKNVADVQKQIQEEIKRIVGS